MTESVRRSKALVDLLRKFDGYPMSQSDVERYFGNQGWEEVLGMTVSEAFSILKSEELIRMAKASTDAPYLANYLLSVGQLKTLLKREGIKTTGKKADLFNRLNDLKPSLLTASLPPQTYFIPTEQGRALLAKRVNEQRSIREQCELAIMEHLERVELIEAIHEWNQYAEEEPFVSAIENSRVDREISILTAIHKGSCSYLESRLPSNSVNYLRIYAALRHLCGKNLSKVTLEKLQPDFEAFKQLESAMAPELAARMLTFYATGQENLRSFKRMGYRLVSTSSCGDSCEHCQSQSMTKHSIELAPELPHQFCTHDSGCRCTYLICSD